MHDDAYLAVVILPDTHVFGVHIEVCKRSNEMTSVPEPQQYYCVSSQLSGPLSCGTVRLRLDMPGHCIC